MTDVNVYCGELVPYRDAAQADLELENRPKRDATDASVKFPARVVDRTASAIEMAGDHAQ